MFLSNEITILNNPTGTLLQRAETSPERGSSLLSVPS